MNRLFLLMLAFAACGGVVDSGDGGAPDASLDAASDQIASDAPSAGDGSPPPDAAPPVPDAGIGAIPGLALWLEASTGVAQNQSRVSAWADQSGLGNDATQSLAARQPTFVAVGIGGRPALHFTPGATEGSQLAIKDSPSMQWGTGDFLIEVVARFVNDPAGGFATGLGGLLFKKGGLGGVIFAGNRTPQGNPPVSAGLMMRVDMLVPGSGNQVDVGASYNDGVARGYAFHRVGATLDLRVNGASVASMTQVGSVDVSATGVAAYMGADDTDSLARLDGDIAEVIAVKGPTSPADLASVEAYLQAKYGL